MEIPKGDKRGVTRVRTKNIVLAALGRNPDLKRRLRILDKQNFSASHPEAWRRLPGPLAVRQQIPDLPLATEPVEATLPFTPTEATTTPFDTPLHQAQEIIPPPTHMSLE